MSYLHMSKDISKVVDDLKLQQVCLLGHSMGGKAVMCASLMTPEKYDKLVVLDISPVTKPSVQSLYPIVDLLSSVNLEEIGRKCGGNLAAVRSFLMEDWKEAVPDFTMRAFLLTNLEVKDRKVFWRVNLNAIKNCWQQIKSFPEKELSGRVFDRPTLVLAASKGDYLSASDVPAIRKYFPQAQILQIANTGHWIHFDAPNTVISLLTSFMQKESIDVTSYTDVTELK
uniref:sn-1-specific diacylglycerol lipase ABHD11 n=2 Tax=Trichobilharzia regenti TaxID=157069 RepID=A0AA85JA17_TRIRE|nr:unnamed protein product [Trichobilharzia regenti]